MPTSPRCLFLAKPPAPVREHLQAELMRLGLCDRLGGASFAPLNWHQSLSDRFEHDAALIERLLSAGRKISARAPRFRIDRVESVNGVDAVHWAFKPDRKPLGFDRLLQSVRTAIAAVDKRKLGSHTPHVTISYRAPMPLRMVQIEPIEWIVDEVMLVRGGGDPYHYEIIGTWPLQAPEPVLASEQLSLF